MQSQCQTDWFLNVNFFLNASLIFPERSYISAAKLFWCCLNLSTSVCAFALSEGLRAIKQQPFIHSPRSSTYIFVHGLKCIPCRFFSHIGLSSWCFIDAAYRPFLMLNEKSYSVLGNCFETVQTVHSNTCSQICSCFNSCLIAAEITDSFLDFSYKRSCYSRKSPCLLFPSHLFSSLFKGGGRKLLLLSSLTLFSLAAFGLSDDCFLILLRSAAPVPTC